MSHFKAKMHQIVCRLGLRPDSASLQRSLRPPSRILGAYFESKGKGREKKGGEWRVEKGRKGKRGKERRGWGIGRDRAANAWPQNYFPGAGAVESAYWTSY